jgi:predicted NAD/FAD-dependent oxidoreductase
MSTRRVAVVGAGISGVAAALALRSHGIDVTVLDRGHRLGGRMATRTLRGTGLPYDGRVVDVGAAYLTVSEPAFRAVVDSWAARGLVREWTDTFHVSSPEGPQGVVTGPMRYAAPTGLRSLVEDLAADLPVVVNPREVESVDRVPDGAEVDGESYDAVVLAMPGPQALDLLAGDDPAAAVLGAQRWDPVLTVVAAYDERCWHEFDAMFVNDSAVLGFVADDGRRRGDDAPVLVAHSGGVLAAGHLDDPASASGALLEALEHAVGATAKPTWFDVRRWSLAKPRRQEPAPFFYDGVVGLCGDVWGDGPRVEAAWRSGHELGGVVAARLA